MDEHDVLAKTESRRNWERARQAAFFEDLMGLFSDKTNLLSFEEVRRGLRLGQKNYKGIQEIPISQIRGSVGRYRDFTSTFLPRIDKMRQRWERISAMVIARGLEAIEVYQVGEAYFVLDGNHRVSVARSARVKTLLAHVWEFQTPVGLSPQADLDEVMIKSEYADFLAETQLDRLRPEQKIEFSTPGRYRAMSDQIALYKQALEKIDGVPVTFEEAAAAWYDMIYLPSVEIVQRSGIMHRFPGRSEADLFAWLWRHHREIHEQYGSQTFEETIAELIKQSERGLILRLWDRLRRLFQTRVQAK